MLKSLQRFVTDTVSSIQDGSFKAEAVMYPLPADWGPLLSDTDLFPDELYEEALEIQAMVASDEIDVQRDETCA